MFTYSTNNTLFASSCPALKDMDSAEYAVDTLEIDYNHDTLTGTKIVKFVSGNTTTYKAVHFENSAQSQIKDKNSYTWHLLKCDSSFSSDRKEYLGFISSLGAKYKRPLLSLSDFVHEWFAIEELKSEVDFYSYSESSKVLCLRSAACSGTSPFLCCPSKSGIQPYYSEIPF